MVCINYKDEFIDKKLLEFTNKVKDKITNELSIKTELDLYRWNDVDESFVLVVKICNKQDNIYTNTIENLVKEIMDNLHLDDYFIKVDVI